VPHNRHLAPLGLHRGRALCWVGGCLAARTAELASRDLPTPRGSAALSLHLCVAGGMKPMRPRRLILPAVARIGGCGDGEHPMHLSRSILPARVRRRADQNPMHLYGPTPATPCRSEPHAPVQADASGTLPARTLCTCPGRPRQRPAGQNPMHLSRPTPAAPCRSEPHAPDSSFLVAARGARAADNGMPGTRRPPTPPPRRPAAAPYSIPQPIASCKSPLTPTPVGTAGAPCRTAPDAPSSPPCKTS